MLQISAQMLAMSSEYAVLEKNGKVVYANTGAQSLLGSNCVGMSIAAAAGSADAALLSATAGAVDRAVAKGVIHKNAANRKKARMAKRLAKAQA